MRITRCDRCGEIINPLYADDFYLRFGVTEYQLCEQCATDLRHEVNEHFKNRNKNTGGHDNCCSVVSSMNKNTVVTTNDGPTY